MGGPRDHMVYHPSIATQFETASAANTFRLYAPVAYGETQGTSSFVIEHALSTRWTLDTKHHDYCQYPSDP